MDKYDPPTSFGIFKPTGHTLMAFQDETQLQEAMAALASAGFEPDSMVRYTPQEMAAQVETQLQSHNPLANFGYEIDLIRVYKGLAQEGCSFLVVAASTDALQAKVAELIKRMNPVSAQHYGRILIEDLTENHPGRMAGKSRE
ncbi:MAG: hypothetical protein ORN28_01655 [Rhodoferax sp.]|nr:hypothetical protein [Rhodoferax sp.]